MTEETYKGRRIEIDRRGGVFRARLAGEKNFAFGKTAKEARERLFYLLCLRKKCEVTTDAR